MAYSQSTEADSLRSAIKYDTKGEPSADTATVNLLNELGNFYRFTELDSTMKYSILAEGTAEKINYTKGKLYANYLKGIIHFNRGQYEKVYEIAASALSEAGIDSFQQERAILNQLMGLSYAAQGSYQPGLSYFLNARDLFIELDNDHGVFQNLNNIGVSYLKLENYDDALDIFLELDSLRTLDSESISIPVNLGFIYTELGEYEKAEEQLMRVLNFEGENYDQRAMGLSTFKLGELYLEKQNYNEALSYFNRSIEVYEKLQNELEMVQSYNGIARTYLQMGMYEEAIKFGEQAYSVANSLDGLPEKNTSSQTLYKIHKAMGNYKVALEYHEQFKTLSDSLHNEDISREVGRVEAEYNYKNRELELQEAQQQKNLENAKKVASRNIFILISFSLFFIAAVIAYSQYRNSNLRKKANKELQEKNDKIEQQANRLEELNNLKTHLFSIISHDLRGPLSSLYGFITLNKMDALSPEQIQEMIPDLADKFEYTSNLLNNLLNWAKSQLDGYNVEPETFELLPEVEENRKLLDQQAVKKDITIKNNVSSSITVYADNNMISLVLLNLLSNAIKFTPEGGEIELSAQQLNGETKFKIIDTGMGIPENKLKLLFEDTGFYSTEGTNEEQGTGLGLMLCQDFIQKNNGDFGAESTVGEGSTFYFTLPATQN